MKITVEKHITFDELIDMVKDLQEDMEKLKEENKSMSQKISELQKIQLAELQYSVK